MTKVCWVNHELNKSFEKVGKASPLGALRKSRKDQKGMEKKEDEGTHHKLTTWGPPEQGVCALAA